MKTIFAASFGALMLAGLLATAQAAPPVTAADPVPSAPATFSTPYTSSSRGSEALPVFNYQGAVPVTSSVDPGPTNSVAPVHINSAAPWNVNLVHQTGDGSR